MTVPASPTAARVKPERRRRRSAAAEPRSRDQLHAAAAVQPRHAVFSADGRLIGVSSERQELLCSLIGLLVKCSLVTVVSISLLRLAVAYQERMDRQGELSAVLEIEQGKLAKARERFDQLFGIGGEQQLIREQSQWIAPNRLRVLWNQPPASTPGT